MTRLTIATRRSVLALWQAEHVADRLRAGTAGDSGTEVELLPIVTEGDRRRDRPLSQLGGKSLFVKALQEAMLEGRADLAVHSLKDVPAEMPDGLGLQVVLERDDPRDALLTNGGGGLDSLPDGALVGTCSLRRTAQLRALRPDVRIEMLRGNIDTRLRRLQQGDFDAIILSAAGLDRLGLHDHISERIDPGVMLPAVGQGAMAIEARDGDTAVNAYLAPLNHGASTARTVAERALNGALDGGCSVPVGAYAELDAAADALHLRGLVAATDGSRILRAEATAPAADADALGRRVAEDLLGQGAAEVIAAARAEVAAQAAADGAAS